jgi:hypothetical protein
LRTAVSKCPSIAARPQPLKFISAKDRRATDSSGTIAPS